MRILLALAVVALSSLCFPSAVPPDGGLVSIKELASFRGLIGDTARLGLADEVAELRGLLLVLGADPEGLTRFEAKWQRSIERAKPDKRGKGIKTLRKKLQREIGRLEREFDGLEAADRLRLAEVLVQLDSTSRLGCSELGDVQVEGVWRSPRSVAWRAGATRVEELMRRARVLEIPVDSGPSSMPAAVAVYGSDAHQVSAEGIHLHGGIDSLKLERILREALRAAGLSKAVLSMDEDEELTSPTFSKAREFFFVSEEADFEAALDEALEAGGITSLEHQRFTTISSRSFYDSRGWRTSRWRTEADFQALLVWDLSDSWMGRGVQPCFLAGHLNWLSLNFFGSTLPSVSWAQSQPGSDNTTAKRSDSTDSLWLSATSSLYGCRAWIRARIEAGDRFPFERAIVPKLGMIVNEALLKATLMAEYLAATGRLWAAIESTRGREDRIAAVEAAVGAKLPALDEEWTRWLFDEDRSPGLVQRLGSASGQDAGGSPEAAAMLAGLRVIRKQALGQLDVWFSEIELFEELGDQALAHAAYLRLNPEQLEAWPDAHEEYADREGFSPAGARAGARSVIDEVAEPEQALDRWMATFYHRLPLLEPGLFGIGYGNASKLQVLDVASLVAPYWGVAWVAWPPAGMTEVPRHFQPELPNPVPGADQSEWGYPITVQTYWGQERGDFELELELFEGDTPNGEPLDCILLTPKRPKFARLVPKNAFCLIPMRSLKADATYCVRAQCIEAGLKKTWTFTTGS